MYPPTPIPPGLDKEEPDFWVEDDIPTPASTEAEESEDETSPRAATAARANEHRHADAGARARAAAQAGEPRAEAARQGPRTDAPAGPRRGAFGASAPGRGQLRATAGRFSSSPAFLPLPPGEGWGEGSRRSRARRMTTRESATSRRRSRRAGPGSPRPDRPPASPWRAPSRRRRAGRCAARAPPAARPRRRSWSTTITPHASGISSGAPMQRPRASAPSTYQHSPRSR